MPDSEFLTAEELAEITGYKHPGSQREWLDANGWQYVLNAARRPTQPQTRGQAVQEVGHFRGTASDPQNRHLLHQLPPQQSVA